MAKFNLKPVKVARYQHNSLDIASALKTLKASGVTAIILVGTYKPLSVFINNAYEQQFSTEYPSEVIVTEVAPNPDKCNVYWCHEFLQGMAVANITKPNSIHFESYLNAVVFIAAAQRCTTPLQRECLMQHLNIIFSEQKKYMRYSLIKQIKINILSTALRFNKITAFSK